MPTRAADPAARPASPDVARQPVRVAGTRRISHTAVPRHAAALLRRSRRTLLAAAALLAGAAACGPAALGPETARAFEGARRFGAELQATAAHAPATPRDTAALLALGYLERARLGLGSPFRLVDFALNDRRLPPALRDSTAWAVLAMVWDGRTHRPDPAAFDSLLAGPAAPGAAEAQLARVERAIAAATSPRAGEHAVRLAYALGATEGIVRTAERHVPARAAAQVRDRLLARRDLVRLLAAARAEQASPLRLVPSWRIARRFDVERPVLAALDPAEEIAAVRQAPALVAELRRLALGGAPAAGDTVPASPSLLTRDAASRLADLPQVRGQPPQAPVVVAMTASRPRLLRAAEGSAMRRARTRLVERATTGEALVAELARMHAPDGQVAGAALWASVGMRTLAQEAPWFPGDAGPTAAELRARFGIADVTFDRRVPEAWRPFYRRMLATAAEDMRRVLPTLSLDGVSVHFGGRRLEGALAVHDPRTRTVFLPLGTGPGTLAHELAHDLDWQTASRRFGRRGEYSTDQAVRERRGRLAASVRGLTTATLVPPGPDNQFRPSHAQRPTEVFASSVDWFVTASLASMGRVNGYLSSVQDEAITGFSDVRPPDAHGDAGAATLDVLAEMTTLPPALQASFLEAFGPGRAPTALERAARVAELSADVRTRPRTLVAPRPFGGAPGLVAAPVACVAREVDEHEPLRAARREAAMLAAEAVARRLVLRRGLDAPLGDARIRLGPDATVPPPVDPALVAPEIRRVRALLLDRVQRVDDARSWLPIAGDAYRPYCD